MNPVFPTFRRWLGPGVNLFPLMTRELTEQSARRRTYVLRTVYAVALYGFTLWVFWNRLGSWSNQSFEFLGQGRQFFDALAWLQFGGLYLFLPAMTSGLLTVEKERDTLSLLLLTRLGPWSILLGKLCSRLVPMGMFVLLSLPLVAVAYSMGGVNEVDILALGWTLGVTAVQVGALALACSAWFRTTAGAFIATYLMGIVLIGGLPFLTQGGRYDPFGLLQFVSDYVNAIGLSGNQGGRSFHREELTFVLFGPWASLHPSSMNLPFHLTVLRTVPMLMSAGVCLAFARLVLWRRAFVPPSNTLLKIFRSLDGLFHRLNQNRVTRGIVLTREHVTLPVFDPIRWRETKKRSLGTTRYLIRLLLVLEFPVVFLMLTGDNSSPTSAIYFTAWILWVLATLFIVIQSSGLIGSERSRQTLDVLLTTPMSSEQIVREKFAGVWRLIRMLWIPFATVYLFQVWWVLWVGSRPFFSNHVHFGLLRGLLAVAIYPPLIAWLGFHLGMRCRSQTQATVATLGLIVGVCLVPYLLAEFLVSGEMDQLRWISPAVVLSASAEVSDHWLYSTQLSGYANWSRIAWTGMMVHFALAGLLLIVLRSRGLSRFAAMVHRNDGVIMDDDDIDRMAALRKKFQPRRSPSGDLEPAED